MPTEREVREIIKRLKKDGWEEKTNRGKGSHICFEKACRPHVIVPTSHKEVSIGTYRSIAKIAGWITKK